MKGKVGTFLSLGFFRCTRTLLISELDLPASRPKPRNVQDMRLMMEFAGDRVTYARVVVFLVELEVPVTICTCLFWGGLCSARKKIGMSVEMIFCGIFLRYFHRKIWCYYMQILLFDIDPVSLQRLPNRTQLRVALTLGFYCTFPLTSGTLFLTTFPPPSPPL
jgi:hypothetical protein